MSVKLKNAQDLAELQGTLASNSHIQEVFFAANGDHYFTKHELVKKGKATGRYYGFLGLQYEPSAKDAKLFKPVHVEQPSAEIVETLTRKKVLELIIKAGKVTDKTEVEK